MIFKQYNGVQRKLKTFIQLVPKEYDTQIEKVKEKEFLNKRREVDKISRKPWIVKGYDIAASRNLSLCRRNLLLNQQSS